MNVVVHADGAAFLARAAESLERAEAENNLALGIAGAPPATVDGAPAPYFATVEESGVVQLAAVWTPPWNLCITAGPPSAIAALADDMRARALAPAGVIGPVGAADAFAAGFAPSFRVAMRQRIYQLTRVAPPRPVSGRLRAAAPSETDRVAEWLRAFADDAGLPAIAADASRRDAERRIASGATFVWDDGGAVSVAAAAGPTRHGIRINFVYTPPSLRRRGYASACVAGLSARLLAEGRRFCFLYTDLANATSNGIYQAIGYEPVGDALSIRFD